MQTTKCRAGARLRLQLGAVLGTLSAHRAQRPGGWHQRQLSAGVRSSAAARRFQLPVLGVAVLAPRLLLLLLLRSLPHGRQLPLLVLVSWGCGLVLLGRPRKVVRPTLLAHHLVHVGQVDG